MLRPDSEAKRVLQAPDDNSCAKRPSTPPVKAFLEAQGYAVKGEVGCTLDFMSRSCTCRRYGLTWSTKV